MDVTAITVPTMTSNATPSGRVIYSNLEVGDAAYNVFDRDDLTYTIAASGAQMHSVCCGYDFMRPVYVYRAQLTHSGGYVKPASISYKYQASTDGNTYCDASQIITLINRNDKQRYIQCTLLRPIHARCIRMQGIGTTVAHITRDYDYHFKALQFYSKDLS